MADPGDRVTRDQATRRHAERRRQILLRRTVALGSLALLMVAVTVATVLTANGGSKEQEGDAGAPSRRVPLEPHTGPVPILMYHSIRAPKASDAAPILFVGGRDFKEQMDWLAREGYHGVTLSQVYRAWHGGGKLPKKPIVISFDDGYPSQYTVALPVLRELGWPGVLNLTTKNLGEGGITPDMVEAMIDAGWELAAHTINHAQLTGIGKEELASEVAGSREVLRSRFGVPVDFFCYPEGKFNEEVIAAVKRAGFRGATTIRPGLASRDEPFTLNRIRVDGGSSLARFRREFHARAAGRPLE